MCAYVDNRLRVSIRPVEKLMLLYLHVKVVLNILGNAMFLRRITGLHTPSKVRGFNLKT